MRAWLLLKSLTVAELRHVARDPLLRWFVVLSLTLPLLTRWLVLAIDANVELDLQPYYPLIVTGYIGVTPILIGFIVGMVLLDERDDGTLLAVRVTPLTMGRYLAYKLALPVAVTTPLTLIGLSLVGLVPFRLAFVPAVLVSALWAPMMALVMASYAKNKIQGLVLMRISNIPAGVPMFAWFVPPGWQYVFGVLPTFWPLKAFWLAAEGRSSWAVVAVGAIVHVACLRWLLGRFRRALGDS
jgi:fluoroquinolone transport system permease protein